MHINAGRRRSDPSKCCFEEEEEVIPVNGARRSCGCYDSMAVEKLGLSHSFNFFMSLIPLSLSLV